MRTNYKRLKNIVSRNFNEIELIESPARGFVVITDAGTPNEERVRIVLTDFYGSYENQVGIHVKLTKDIESDLVGAVESALKDLFPTIYVYQSPKPSEERRLRRIETVKGWMNNQPRVELTSSLNRLAVDAEDTLATMNEAQLDLLLKFISGIFQSACSTQREHWAPKYHAAIKLLEERGMSHVQALDAMDQQQLKAVHGE